jgi:hypothetical protein
MDLLRETCDATLVAEIHDCDWNSETQTITTPHEKKEDQECEDFEAAAWYQQAFDLKGLGKGAKPVASKAPEALFDLDAEQSIKTIHNRHLTPTFNLLEDDDDESEGLASAANPRPATPPRKSNNTEATSTEYSYSKASPPNDEDVGDKRAAGGG